ncbi:MAG: glycosyltransferase family 4 protein [Halieaceae bacterium]|jgi:glycosyltransferase involved in cell wall biosynthesis|nr:glycosyltransferase family 4 protein [Halieaceae bacterium]
MKVLYNANVLVPPLSGVGIYTQRLGEAMSQLSGVDSVQYFLNERCGDLDELLALSEIEHKREPVVGQPPSIPWHKKILHALLLRYSLREIKHIVCHYIPVLDRAWTVSRNWIEDLRRRRRVGSYVYHETNFVLEAHKGPKVVTVHDLSVIRYPQFHPEKRVKFMNEWMDKSIQRADQIITVSEYIKREVIEHFGLEDSKVTAIAHAADENYHPRKLEECSVVLKNYGLEYRGFLLVVGSMEPRKNLSLLMDAYTDLPSDLKQRYPIVHVGPPGWNNSEIVGKTAKLEELGWFRSLGYIDQAELPVIFSAAAGLAFPSIYEGFGLPPLEAMASGIPVLATNASSIPEVVGNCGILVDPNSRKELTSGLEKLLGGGSEISEMIEAGLRRSSSYSWHRAAQETLDVYARAQNGY